MSWSRENLLPLCLYQFVTSLFSFFIGLKKLVHLFCMNFCVFQKVCIFTYHYSWLSFFHHVENLVMLCVCRGLVTLTHCSKSALLEHRVFVCLYSLFFFLFPRTHVCVCFYTSTELCYAMLLALLRLSPMFRAWSRDRWEPIRGAHSDGGERRFTRRHTLKLKSKNIGFTKYFCPDF